MKRTLKYLLAAAALLLAGVADSSAQHYFGMRVGYGSGSARLEPERNFENATIWGMYSGGVSWKYYSSEPFVGGVEVDALFMQQGFRQIMRGSSTGEVESAYERHVDVVMVPVFWQPHVYMFKQRLRVFLNAGLTFSYVIGSSEKDISYLTGTVIQREYNMTLTRDNRFGYGLCGGGGITWSVGRLEILAEARYYIGYSDILKNRNVNETNPHLRSPLDGMQFSVGMFWRMGKGGIKSPQGRPVSDEELRRSLDDLPQSSVDTVGGTTETNDAVQTIDSKNN